MKRPSYDRGDLATGVFATCLWCEQDIVAVIDSTSGVLDWGSGIEDNNGLDYGCSDHPDSNEDGVRSHEPARGSLVKVD